MDNPLKNLNLKWWHSVLMTISATMFIISLLVSLPSGGIDNKTLQFLSSGVFFIALGGFANQTFQVGIGPGFTTERDVTKVTPMGVVFILVGLYLLYRGIF